MSDIKEKKISLEIERKYLISRENLPENYTEYPKSELEQAYIITEPVLRIRKKDKEYILTYKGPGFMSRREEEFPLTREAYEKLLAKTEGTVISKTRYKLPEKNGLTIELDIFHKDFEGLILAEVEFPDEESANSYIPPKWFMRDVTNEGTFHNSSLSSMTKEDISKLLANLQ